MQNGNFANLIRLSLGLSNNIDVSLSETDWIQLHELAERQSIVGLLFPSIKIIRQGSRPPRNLAMRWGMEAEMVRGLNREMNRVATRLTILFAAQGCRSAILKGQANALLYPDPELRQSGDIDIWVEGGKEKVLEILSKLNLMKGASVGVHDISLSKKHFGFIVEVHFQACSGNRNPFTNRRLQSFLNKELEKISAHYFDDEHYFNIPSKKFAMAMQLSHIQRHFLTVGVGLRQIIDYYYLLKSSSVEDRREFGLCLKKFGLVKIAGALMWALQDFFLLEDQFLICPVDSIRGKRLLHDVLEGGDFGQYSHRTKGSAIRWWLKGKARLISLLQFDFAEVSWQLLRYVPDFLLEFPQKLRLIRRVNVGKTLANSNP